MPRQYTPMRPQVAQICPNCGAAFTAYASVVEKGGGKYCGNACKYAHRTILRDAPEHFWAATDQSGGPDACWEWQRARFANGYGACAARGEKYAHRVAWVMAHGAIPAGIFVCHTCDNPPCCNPAHLFLGTPSENMRDKVAKGRNRGTERLTPEQVRAIRIAARDANVLHRDLAAEYGVAETTISAVVNRVNWKQIE